MIDITIDGIKTTVSEGDTILEAARAIGVEIPTLCRHEIVRPHRACRVCTVEVIRGDKVNYLTACTYKVAEPLVVNTRSEGALARRRTIVEGLLAASPGAAVIARIAREAGIDVGTGASGERCIRCGLCVRVCDQIVGQKALAYEKGAADTPYRTVTDACIGCATCAALCPTGAIVVEEHGGVRRLPQGNKEFKLAACRSCGRPITSELHLAAVRAKRKLPDEVAEVCPSCKRIGFAGRIQAGDSTAPPKL
jgi:bidirectional [NiFe] hydrogenase diaphorase subunit